MNTPKPTPTPARPDDPADNDDDWGVPPGKAEDLKDRGALDALGNAVSEAVKGAVPPDAATEELLRRQRPGT